MAYTHFDQTAPNASVSTIETICIQTIANQKALRDMVASSGLIGWSGTPSGGTDYYPVTCIYSRGVERIRTTTTWGSSGGSTNNPSTVFFEYSSSSGSSYDSIGTMTFAYRSNGTVSAMTWS